MSERRTEPSILHITAPAAFGGLERVVENLSRGLDARGVRTAVVAVLEREDPDHPFVSSLRSAGVDVIPVGIPSRGYRQEMRVLADLVRERRPDVVHTHGYRSDVTGGWVARRARIARVATLHGFTAKSLRGRVSESLQLRALRGYDAVVGVSQAIIDRARGAGVPAPRLHLVPNAWTSSGRLQDRGEARRVLGLEDDAFVAGWVGRLSHEKGADVFLEAMARWPSERAVASIIGDGRERPALEQRAATLGIGTRVRWHGARPDAGMLMRAFDCLVLSSRTEGVPMVLFEAMHAQTPIVATAVGGVPSVLDDSQAILVPSESPDRLASALVSVQSEPVAAKARAHLANELLSTRFTAEAWLDRYLAIYHEIARQRA